MRGEGDSRWVGCRGIDFTAWVAAELLAGDEVLEPAAVVAGEGLAFGLVDEGEGCVADGAGCGLVW